jgi:hypothetical protein
MVNINSVISKIWVFYRDEGGGGRLTNVIAKDWLIILEGSLAKRTVIIIVVVERPAKQILQVR